MIRVSSVGKVVKVPLGFRVRLADLAVWDSEVGLAQVARRALLEALEVLDSQVFKASAVYLGQQGLKVSRAWLETLDQVESSGLRVQKASGAFLVYLALLE